MYLILQLAVGNGCKAVSTSAGAPPSATKWKVPATDGVRSSVVATTWKRNDAIFAPTSFVSQIFVSNQTADDQAYYHDEHGKTVNNISTGRSPVVVRLNGIPGHLSIGLTVLSDAFVVENPYEFSFQQRFDVWIALFHNADAPADYSPLPDR
jgi:hypothetical protein